MSEPSTLSEYKARHARLPKWAQQEIERLERDLRNVTEERDELRAGSFGPSGSNTVIRPYDPQPVNLPDGELVAFRLGFGHDDEVHVRVRHYNELEVRGMSSIAVEPEASNTVRVKVARNG